MAEISNSTIRLDFSTSNEKRRISFLPPNYHDESETNDVLEPLQSFTVNIIESCENPINRSGYEQYCTGSSYIGDFNKLGMTGNGTYRFPHGVIYDGHFNRQGQFHGSGTLIYPNGQKVEGLWYNGKLQEDPNYVTNENSTYTSDYCRTPDRRFQIEIDSNLAPATVEYLTNAKNPPKTIPKGCYDSGTGIYNPKTQMLYDYKDRKMKRGIFPLAFLPPNNVRKIRMMQKKTTGEEIYLKIKDDSKRKSNDLDIFNMPEHSIKQWIISNCRREEDKSVGFHPEFYEEWTTGSWVNTPWTPSSHIQEDIETEKIIHAMSHMPINDNCSECLYSFTLKTDDKSLLSKIDSLEAIKLMFSKNDPKIKDAIIRKRKSYRQIKNPQQQQNKKIDIRTSDTSGTSTVDDDKENNIL